MTMDAISRWTFFGLIPATVVLWAVIWVWEALA